MMSRRDLLDEDTNAMGPRTDGETPFQKASSEKEAPEHPPHKEAPHAS